MIRRIIILLLIVTGCRSSQTLPASTSSPAQPVAQSRSKPADDPPEWVTKKPALPGYYVGIGNASVSNPDYQSIAKLEALDDMGSEVSITVSSTSLLHQIEDESGFQESFRASIQAATHQELQAYEMVDSWNDGKYYWVQYRLSKATLESLRKARHRAALQKALHSFTHAQESEPNDYVQAIRFYAETIDILKEYLHETNEVLIGEEKVLLANESYARIQKLLAGIKLVSESPVVFASTEKEKTIEILACYGESRHPVARLPLILTIGDQEEKKVSGPEGIFARAIRRNEAFHKSLAATFSLDFLSEYEVAGKLLKGFPVAKIEIAVSAAPPVFSVAGKEQNLASPLSNKILAPLLTKILTEKGAEIARAGQYEYELLIDANTRAGTEMSGLYSAFLDFTISIKDKQGRVVFSDSFNGVKGLHTSYEKAGLAAYSNVEKELTREIKSSLDKHFFKRN